MGKTSNKISNKISTKIFSVISILVLSLTASAFDPNDMDFTMVPSPIMEGPVVIKPGTPEERELFAPWVALRTRFFNKSNEHVVLNEMIVAVRTLSVLADSKSWTFDLNDRLVYAGSSLRLPDEYISELPKGQAYQIFIVIKYTTVGSGMSSAVAKTVIVD